MTEPLYVKRAEAAELLGVSAPTLDRYVADKLVPSFKIDQRKKGARLFAVQDLKNLARRWSESPTPNQRCALFIDPDRKIVEQRQRVPVQDYTRHSFGLVIKAPLILTDLQTETRVCENGVAKPVPGALWCVSLAKPSSAAAFTIGGHQIQGPAFLAGRFLEADTPNPGAKEWGMLMLADYEIVRSLIEWGAAATDDAPAEPSSDAAASEAANGGEQ